MTTANLFHAITDTFLCTFLEFLYVLANAINNIIFNNKWVIMVGIKI